MRPTIRRSFALPGVAWLASAGLFTVIVTADAATFRPGGAGNSAHSISVANQARTSFSPKGASLKGRIANVGTASKTQTNSTRFNSRATRFSSKATNTGASTAGKFNPAGFKGANPSTTGRFPSNNGTATNGTTATNGKIANGTPGSTGRFPNKTGVPATPGTTSDGPPGPIGRVPNTTGVPATPGTTSDGPPGPIGRVPNNTGNPTNIGGNPYGDRPVGGPIFLPRVGTLDVPVIYPNQGPLTNQAPPTILLPGGNRNPGGATPPVARRSGSGVPPANERRYVPDEVVVEVPDTFSDQATNTIARRYRLARLQTLRLPLTGTTFVRWKITDRRSVPVVIRALETEAGLLAVQPNYLAELNQAGSSPTQSAGDPAQYALTKLNLPQAHGLARGDQVLIGVIDSGVDVLHPELAGLIAGSYDALASSEKAHIHGTGIAGAIVAHSNLMGSAPAARILAVRAFGATRSTAQGTSIAILDGLNWAVANGARIINMSFAGADDPAIARNLAAANARGIILVAAAGNGGPKAAPPFPGKDPNVIAVTATDANDNLFTGANLGYYVAVAAPGVDILLPAPNATYQVTTGTSFSAAEISGVIALLLERNPDLTPAAVRQILVSTARDLGPKGRDPYFGAGLVDAYRAILSLTPAMAGEPAATLLPVSNPR
jgi:hypothetical protein